MVTEVITKLNNKKTMKKILYIVPLVLTALVSCQKEELPTAGSDVVTINAAIGESIVDTRVNSGGAETTAWTIGDRIAVNNEGDNYVNYTYSGTTWAAAPGESLKWSTSTMTFNGYYPVTEGTSLNDFVLPTAQDDVDVISVADYMTVSENKTKHASGSDVDLNFTRKTARVIIKITKIQTEFVGTPIISNFKITSAYAHYHNGATAGNPVFVDAYKASDDRYIALVIPYNSTLNEDFITLDVTDETGTKSLKLSTVYATEAGKSYTHNLTVGKSKIELGSVVVENWHETEIIPEGDAELEDGTFVVENKVDGGLTDKITESDWDKVIFLSVSGTLNYFDFEFIRDDLKNLKILDLSQTTITEIPNHALNYYKEGQSGNLKLRKVILPPTVKTIGENAFQYAEALTSISLNGVETIGLKAFFNCSALTTVNLGDKLETINNSVFYKCTSLQSIEIPASVRTLGRWMFEGCSSLKSIKLNEGVEVIPNSAFYGCAALEMINIPASIKILGSWMFEACSNLKTVELPEGIETIPASAFFGAYGLTSFNIPTSVKTIGDYAFASCLNLKTITIPKTVTSLGVNMFVDCFSLTNATVLADVTTIPTYMFNNCNGLIKCMLNDKIQVINESAFSSCTKLSDINIPSSLTTIGNGAFSNTAITSVTLPSGVSTIGEKAFYNSPISSLIINSTVDLTIGHQAFFACSKQFAPMDITLPATLKSLSCTSFHGNSTLRIICHAVTPPEIITGDPSIDPNPKYWEPYSGCYMKVPAGSVAAYKDIFFWDRSFQAEFLHAIE